MTAARLLAEKIVLMTRQDRYAKATVLESAVESLLAEALEEAKHAGYIDGMKRAEEIIKNGKG